MYGLTYYPVGDIDLYNCSAKSSFLPSARWDLSMAESEVDQYYKTRVSPSIQRSHVLKRLLSEWIMQPDDLEKIISLVQLVLNHSPFNSLDGESPIKAVMGLAPMCPLIASSWILQIWERWQLCRRYGIFKLTKHRKRLIVWLRYTSGVGVCQNTGEKIRVNIANERGQNEYDLMLGISCYILTCGWMPTTDSE